jgi:hypothetical protein
MTRLKIGPVDTIVFFSGAVPWVIRAIRESVRLGLKTHVFASTRHLADIADIDRTQTFRDLLEEERISYSHTDDINSSSDLDGVVSERTMGIGIGETYVFSPATIRKFGGRLFDFMTIRLPQYRGGAHFTWQILRQSRIGCWNIELIDEKMVPGVCDSGKILRTHEYLVPSWAKTPKDYAAVADGEALLLYEGFLRDVQAGREFEIREIQEDFSLFLPRLSTNHHGWIDWSWSALELDRFISAFDDPYPGASTMISGKRVHLKGAHADLSEGAFHPFMAGLIYRIAPSGVFVAVRDGALIVERVLDEQGRNSLDRVKVGSRFQTPMKHLEEARMFDAEYDAQGLLSKNK